MLRKYVIALSLFMSAATSAEISPKSVESLLSLQVRQDGKYDIICTDRKREIVTQPQLILGAVCPARDISAPTFLSLQRLQDGRFSVICNNLSRQIATADEISSGKVCKSSNAGTPLGSVNGREFFKVKTEGKMYDANVRKACEAAGLKVPCNDRPNGSYSDGLCVDVNFRDDGNPMRTLSRAICNGADPSRCAALEGSFQYMGEKWNGRSCGVVNGDWCAYGDSHENLFAVCVN
jgi:hypothetical protein